MSFVCSVIKSLPAGVPLEPRPALQTARMSVKHKWTVQAKDSIHRRVHDFLTTPYEGCQLRPLHLFIHKLLTKLS